jgi:ABC-2 type transport system permease protein
LRLPSWSRIAELLRKERRQMLRDPRMRMMMFVSPIIQLILFGYAVNMDIKNTATFVIDHDGSTVSRELIDTFTSTGYFEVVGRSSRPADLVSALDHGQAVVGIEIPADFSTAVNTGNAKVQVVVDGTNSNTGTVAQGYAAQIVQRFAQRRAMRSGTMPPGGVDLRTRAWYNPELESRVYNVPAIIGVLVMLMCLLLTSLAVVREREMGTLDQLMVSPLTPTELMLGKTLPVMVVGLIDLALISAVAILWFGIPLRGSVFALIPAALLYILAGLSFGLFISAISKTQQEAFMSMFLLFFPMMILSGFFYPISTMPRVFQWLTIANPIRHFLEIVRAIFLKGEGFVGLWPQYVLLAVIAGLALRFAIVRFRSTVVS